MEDKATKKDKKDALKAMKAQLEECENNLAKEKDDYIRLMAEFENFRRRSAAERLELINTASEKIILELLPVIDDCERAMKALGESSDSAAAKEGTELIYNKLMAVLKAKGLKMIEAADKPFDTEFMEAVAQFPAQSEEQKGKVFDVVQNGYMLGEKVIRYAKVVVAQ
ncbi:MAG: nucleotide exchange factor GrpE [Bacteroidales bacterium]|nr:nucleotide exchange factor GrpE [Bacteroidales bacterium]